MGKVINNARGASSGITIIPLERILARVGVLIGGLIHYADKAFADRGS